MSNPSIFTRIVNGEIPCNKIYEDDMTLAFLDMYPATEGHTLVIPKKEVEFVWDLDDENYIAVMQTVKKVARHLRDVTGKNYVGVKIIGTDVPHAHVHVIPFDSSSEMYNPQRVEAAPDHESLALTAEKLRF